MDGGGGCSYSGSGLLLPLPFPPRLTSQDFNTHGLTKPTDAKWHSVIRIISNKWHTT